MTHLQEKATDNGRETEFQSGAELTSPRDFSSPRRGWNLTAEWYFFMMLIGTACSAVAQVPMARDGSYYFLRMWETGQPLIAHGRVAAHIIQMPLLAVIAQTQDFHLSRWVFDITYSAIPFVALLMSWLCVRKTHPHLMVWPVAASLISIPSRPDYISENNIASAFIWPAFLCLLSKPSVWNTVIVLALTTLAMLLHPVAIPLLGVMSACAIYLAFRQTDSRKSRIALALIVAGCFIYKTINFVTNPQPYEQGLFNESAFRDLISCGLAWPASITMIAGAAGTLLILLREKSKLTLAAILAMFTVAGAAAVYWSAEPQFWFQCFWYQKLMLIPSALLMVLALIDSQKNASLEPRTLLGDKLLKRRAYIWNAVGLLSAAALVVQSNSWMRISEALLFAVNSKPQQIINREDIEWVKHTPFDHWSACSYAIVLQAKYPHKYVLEKTEAERARTTGEFRITSWDVTYKGNHFHLPEQ